MSTLTLTVTAYQGRPADGSLHADFDETGGTIGRADTNQLVLPDPDRSISRVHAQIIFRHGRYALIDRGSSPVQVNGLAAKNDAEMVLADGDRLTIGGYELTVSWVTARARSPSRLSGVGAGGMEVTGDDPFADLLGALPAAQAHAAGTAGPPDPLAGLGSPAAPVRTAPAATGNVGSARAAGALPEDWNPFAPGAPSSPPAGAHALFGPDSGLTHAPPLLTELVDTAESESLDALFDLGNAPPGGADPFALSALAQPAAQPNMAAHADPFRSLGSTPVATRESLSDTVSDLNLPFVAVPLAPVGPATLPAVPLAEPPAEVLPPAQPDEITPAATSARTRPAWTAPSHAEAMVPTQTAEGWGLTADVSMPTPVPTPMSIPMSIPMSTPMPDSTPVDLTPVGLTPASITPVVASMRTDTPTATTPTTPAAAPLDMALLCQALCEGLDTTDLRIDALTPELMRLLGRLLRDATEGTIDLLFERATLKRELKAESKAVRARESNPLKFSPNADVALRHLLAPPARGVMGGDRAMRDAYIDLRAFQFGMLAGMRSAIDDTLDRFAPSALETRLAQRPVARRLLPGSRKARLWEQFAEQFAQIRDGATDDFQTVLGSAFLKAYDEHIAQLGKDGS